MRLKQVIREDTGEVCYSLSSSADLLSFGEVQESLRARGDMSDAHIAEVLKNLSDYPTSVYEMLGESGKG